MSIGVATRRDAVENKRTFRCTATKDDIRRAIKKAGFTEQNDYIRPGGGPLAPVSKIFKKDIVVQGELGDTINATASIVFGYYRVKGPIDVEDLDHSLTVLTTLDLGKGFGHILSRAFKRKDITEKGQITLEAPEIESSDAEGYVTTMIERLDTLTCSFSDLAEGRVIEAAETVEILDRLWPGWREGSEDQIHKNRTAVRLLSDLVEKVQSVVYSIANTIPLSLNKVRFGDMVCSVYELVLDREQM